MTNEERINKMKMVHAELCFLLPRLTPTHRKDAQECVDAMVELIDEETKQAELKSIDEHCDENPNGIANKS